MKPHLVKVPLLKPKAYMVKHDPSQANSEGGGSGGLTSMKSETLLASTNSGAGGRPLLSAETIHGPVLLDIGAVRSQYRAKKRKMDPFRRSREQHAATQLQKVWRGYKQRRRCRRMQVQARHGDARGVTTVTSARRWARCRRRRFVLTLAAAHTTAPAHHKLSQHKAPQSSTAGV